MSYFFVPFSLASIIFSFRSLSLSLFIFWFRVQIYVFSAIQTSTHLSGDSACLGGGHPCFQLFRTDYDTDLKKRRQIVLVSSLLFSFFSFPFPSFFFPFLFSTPLLYRSEVSSFPCFCSSKVVSAPRETLVSSVILVGSCTVHTYILTYIHASRYMNDELQRKRREVDGTVSDGAPPAHRLSVVRERMNGPKKSHAIEPGFRHHSQEPPP